MADANPFAAPCSWNPGCFDVLDAPAYYQHLAQTAFTDSIFAHQDFGPCGGLCGSDFPMCRSNGKCELASCEDAVPFCHHLGVAGIRARQLCPVTCGCARIISNLTLSLTADGCPGRCSMRFREVEQPKCEDVPKDNPHWVQFLDNWESASVGYPKDWRESAQGFIAFLRQWGCDYLKQTAPPADAPVSYWNNFNFGSTNLCVQYGSWYRHKPLSHFCPVACGCFQGDNDCPETCPARNTSLIDYTGVEPWQTQRVGPA